MSDSSTFLQILSLLIPEDESDMSDLVLEVTAGVGGQEAMLFTAEVFDMYQSFAAHQGWGFDILEYMKSEIGQSHSFINRFVVVKPFLLLVFTQTSTDSIL